MTRPRRSTRITGRHHYHEAVRPCAPHQYSTPRGSAAWSSPFHQRPQATTAPLAARGRGATGSHVPRRSPDQARATSMPDTAWPVGRLPPGSSRGRFTPPVSMSSKGCFRHVISGSLALAFLAHTCRAHGAAFPQTLTTTALDRSSLRWFAASPCRAAAEDRQPDRAGPSISDAAPHQSVRSSTSSLLVAFRVHTEPFSLAVGLGPIGPGAEVAEAQRATGDRVDGGSVDRPVVGEISRSVVMP
jgi:hypothetical protein